MKRAITPLLLIALLLSGCRSIPVSVSTGRVKGQTFSFIQPRRAVQPGPKNAAHNYNAAIQDAIKTQLSAKGMTYKESDADLTIAYMIVVCSSSVTHSMGAYFGRGQETDQITKRAIKGATKLYKDLDENRKIDAATTHVGALVIDVLDTPSFDLLYRQRALRPMAKDPTDAERKQRIDEVVGEIFAGMKLAR